MPLENIIKIKDLEDKYGRIILKVGNCEKVVGGKKVPKLKGVENMRVKLLRFW